MVRRDNQQGCDADGALPEHKIAQTYCKEASVGEFMYVNCGRPFNSKEVIGALLGLHTQTTWHRHA